MKKITGCHNCPYNGKGNNICINCEIIKEDYSNPFKKYVLPDYEAPAPEKIEPIQATDLDEDTEDELRQKLYQIFDLDFIELLLLKSIMNGKSLTEFAKDFNQFLEYNNNKKCDMSRFCAFQIRKRMLKKLDKIALLTKGQKKVLKAGI